jgi:hypothetical protein
LEKEKKKKSGINHETQGLLTQYQMIKLKKKLICKNQVIFETSGMGHETAINSKADTKKLRSKVLNHKTMRTKSSKKTI